MIRNGRPYSPVRPEELEIFPGAKEAMIRLKGAGFHIIVVTNQPDVARGLLAKEQVYAIHDLLKNDLLIDLFCVCFHDDIDRCACRKPLPGMLISVAQKKDIDLRSSYMIGDRWRDIEAGRAAGCKTVFIDHGYKESLISEPDIRVKSISEATDWILSHSFHHN
jgi:D-glycero-D-manno-heptose 1,7-bisphosphate phosphatase